MSNIHRIIWIDGQIRAGRHPNCRQIAEHFEISVRQASRDIEYLRYSLGAPLKYSPVHNGYFYEGEAFVLPAHYVSQEQKEALKYLAWRYRNMGDGQALQLAQLFSRLSGESAGAGEPSSGFAPSPRAARFFAVLNEAAKDRRKVNISYCGTDGAITKRDFCPYTLFSKEEKEYVAGFCELRQEIRVFRLDRIRSAELLENQFEIVPWYDQAVVTGFDFRKPYRAVIKADGADRLGRVAQVVGGGGGTWTVAFTNSGKLLSGLIGQGLRFSVISPHWLRLRLGKLLCQLSQDNFGSDIICPAGPDTIPPEISKGGISMSRKLEADFRMCWNSYIGSVDSVLRQAKLWEGDISQLMGMTGMGFRFVMHKVACPSSVNIDDWAAEHFEMMDRIGVHTQIIQAFQQHNTFQQLQQDAVAAVKESIDRGLPVVAWAPTGLLEFGLITGYDDQDQVFFVKDCVNSDPDPLLYTNLGLSEVSVLFVQIFKGRVDVDREKVFRQSLEFGVRQWNKEEHVSPDYASGRKAYSNLIGTLERGDFDPFGLAYNLSVYADAKACLARYLDYVNAQSRHLKGLDQAASLFDQLAGKYKELTRLIPFSGPETKAPDQDNVAQALALVQHSQELEEKAMEVVTTAVEK